MGTIDKINIPPILFRSLTPYLYSKIVASSMGERPGWLPDQLAVLQVLFALGGVLSIFFIGMALLLLTAVLIVLIVFALTGQWHRIPLLIRFIK
ncbi:hypothetical protein [Salibacterium qingdaonense]|uniref:DUF4870 domain-containing protein n=1 Tax=Salibacterium qingdaonense TaxID=266892 RepID=A0A1I4KKY8_9BACI|nr:hypothetical protein [Salibacterium qingdaonense]SFL79249.1 hypothetical protein SAMN04488054_10571 [Salibacterium qingdaonense]